MKVYSARCPDCGFMNRGLYLEETLNFLNI